MKRQVRIRPEAEADLADAFSWYESHLPGLGETLIDQVDETLSMILENPMRFPKVHHQVRRAVTRRFPYQIYFIHDTHSIHVLAIFHARRNPNDWIERA